MTSFLFNEPFPNETQPATSDKIFKCKKDYIYFQALFLYLIVSLYLKSQK